MSEAAVLAAVLDYFSMRSEFRVWRNNSGALKDQRGRLVRFGLVGSADVIGIRRGGQFVAIECKADGEELSEPQRRFRDMVLAMGGAYVLARSVDDVARAFP